MTLGDSGVIMYKLDASHSQRLSVRLVSDYEQNYARENFLLVFLFVVLFVFFG